MGLTNVFSTQSNEREGERILDTLGEEENISREKSKYSFNNIIICSSLVTSNRRRLYNI